MAKPLEGLLGRLRRTVSPTQVAGAPGTAIFGGYVHNGEVASRLSQPDQRYRTYSEILANVSIVAAGVRYFLNLTAGAEWSFTPSKADKDGKYAELAQAILTDDPRTPWHRIVRRAAMFRFYGFSVQEWIARRRDDGVMTLADVAPRAQRTIERWDLDVEGNVLGAIQTNPQNNQSLYLPRGKLLYMVDDTLNDSPEGLGLFRHLVRPSERLQRYEQLEGFGFETDLRGTPVGRGPFTKLAEMEKSGQLTRAQRIAIEAPMRDFVQNHVKTPQLGMLLDSAPYESQDEAARPSSTSQWSLELLKGTTSSQPEMGEAIGRVNRELARILGVEQLLLGEGAGSFALSKDKTQSFFLLVDASLREVRETVDQDLLDTVWKLNGWPDEMKPEMGTEAVQARDIEQVAASLRDMAAAGAILSPNDPAINEVRDLLGLSHQPTPEGLEEDEDSSLRGEMEGSAEEDEMPEDPTLERED